MRGVESEVFQSLEKFLDLLTRIEVSNIELHLNISTVRGCKTCNHKLRRTLIVKTRAMTTRDQELLASRGIPSEEEIKSLRDKFSPTEKIKKIRKRKRQSEVLGNRKVT